MRALVDTLVSGLAQGTLDAAEQAHVSDWSEVRLHSRRMAVFAPEPQATNRRLKQFLHHAVYFSEPMVEERRQSAARIRELFEFYLSRPDRLPENYAETLTSAPLHRVVCDYIAGMTDGFFLRCYQQNLTS